MAGEAYPVLMKRSSGIDIFQYKDYRRFLQDWYQAAKSTGALSYRSFAQRAGLKSINFLKFVMEGDRNLSEKSIAQFALALKLNKQESEFFRNLVFYNQAETHDDKNRAYQSLLRSRKYHDLKPIESAQYEYYSTWYHPAVRELVVAKANDGTPEWIASRLSPEVTVEQVVKSLELLERLGMIRKDEAGRWRQASLLVSTGAELASHVVHRYHKVLLDLAGHVMDDVSGNGASHRRDVSTMTLGVAKERIPQLKKRVQEFRQDILKLVASDTEPEEVIQLNIQMFPLTQAQTKEQA